MTKLKKLGKKNKKWESKFSYNGDLKKIFNGSGNFIFTVTIFLIAIEIIHYLITVFNFWGD